MPPLLRRRVRRAAAVAVVVTAVGLPASPAAAHAALERSEPAASAVLEDPPPRVLLDFDEPVDAGTAEIRVLAADGSSVPLDSPGSAGDATQVQVPLPALDDGAYVVAWRVVSDDGHPVNGAFPFQIGLGGADTSALLEAALRQDEPDPAVGTALDVARAVLYAGLALLVGGAAAVMGGYGRVDRRGLLVAGWGAALVATLAVFVLTWPYTTAGTLADAWSLDGWRAVAETRQGRAALVRTVLLALVAPLLGRVRPAPARGERFGAAGVAVVLALTLAVAGHAGTERWPLVGIVLDAAHVLAMALWLGGLAFLAVGLPRVEARPVGAAVALDAEPGVAVARFSRLALWCVGVLVVTGVLQAWRLLPDPGAVVDTDYGRRLLVKVVIVAGLVALAAWSRRLVRTGERGAGLWRSVVLELVLAAGVLGVTATLVGTPPDEATASEPVTVQLVQGDTLLDISFTPARVGANELHLTFSPPGGTLSPVASAEARLLLPEREAELGRLPVPLEFAGPNHWIGAGVQVPYPGEWRLEVIAETADGALVRYATPVEIAG